VYHPNLTSTINTQSTTTPSTSTISGTNAAGEAIVSGLSTYNGGIAQQVPWGGGAFTVTLNNNRQTTNSKFTFFNPQLSSNYRIQLSHCRSRSYPADLTG